MHSKITKSIKTLTLLYTSLLFIFEYSFFNSLQAQENRPTVAVVLSGGGAKGVAHISALKAIEEAGIPIDIICGTSMGSLVGGLYCMGYSTDFLDSLVRSQNWTQLLSDRMDPDELTLRQRKEQNTYAIIRGISKDRPQQGGLIRGRNLNKLFRTLCSGYPDSINFDSLPIRFACVATDLVTNTEVIFHSGSLVRAMRASMAIPGVFTPVRIGDSVLVDGGLRNNYPVDIARRMGADIIIGVTVQGDPLKADEIGDAATVMMQIIDINTKHKYHENIMMSDIVMKVDVSGYSAASFTTSAIDTLLRRGKEEALAHMDELIALRKKYNIDSTPRPEWLKTPTETITDKPDYVKKRTRTVPSSPIASAGFRFDTEEMGALILNAKLPLKTSMPMGLAATARLGRRIMFKGEYTLLTQKAGLNPTVNYTFRNNDIDLYTKGIRTHNVRYRQHSVDIEPFDIRLRKYTLRAGIEWDYYDYYGQLLTTSGINHALTDDHYFSYHASAELNTENKWYYPTRGTRFQASYAYRTTNLRGFNGEIGLTDISMNWRVNASPIPRLTIQPMLYGRLLLSDDVPLAYRNAIGNEWFGYIVDQQLPFAGIGHLEYVGNQIIAAQIQLHYRMFSNHYFVARIATAIDGDNPGDLFQIPETFGGQLGYTYMTMFGPLDARLGYSGRTHHPYIYINIGHVF